MKKLIVASSMLVLILAFVQSSAARMEIGLGVGTSYSVAIEKQASTNGDKNHFSLVGGFRARFNRLILNTELDYQSENEDITYILTSRVSLLTEPLKSGFYLGAGIQSSHVKWISGITEGSDDFTYFVQAGWEIPGETASLTLDFYYELSPFHPQNGVDTDFIGLGIRLLFYL